MAYSLAHLEMAKARWPRVDPEKCPPEILGMLEEVDQWQGEIKALDVQLCAEKVALNNNQYDQLKALFNARSQFIESVPGYWFRVLMNHTEISRMVKRKELDCLRHLKNVRVDSIDGSHNGFSITFTFRKNEYFSDEELTKTYFYEKTMIHSTEICWLPPRGSTLVEQLIKLRQRPLKKPWKRAPHCQPKLLPINSFFLWFMENDDPEEDQRIAEIISQDLWMDPHQYYLMKNDLFSDAHGVDTVNWSEDEDVEAEQATE